MVEKSGWWQSPARNERYAGLMRRMTLFQMAFIITTNDYCSYPYNVNSRSIVQVVGDHLLGLLLGRDVSGVDRQLSVRAWTFALGERARVHDEDAFDDLCDGCQLCPFSS